MNRLLATLVVASAAAASAACADPGPTAPKSATAAAGDVVGAAAPLPTGSCSYVLGDAGYVTTVTWSGFSAVSLDISDGNTNHYRLSFHPTRNGNVTVAVTFLPTLAEVVPRTGLGIKVPCSGPGPA